MAWDSTMKREGKSDNQMAHIVYSRFESGDTKAGVMYSLGGLYVRHYVTLVSKEALKRVEKNHPQVVVKGKGVDGWKLYDLEDMGVTREHVVPVLVLYRHLAKLHECGSLTEAYILELMPKLEIALITKEEEKKLRLAHFSRGMPGRDDWWKTERDPLDRYRAAGLDDSIWVKLTQKERINNSIANLFAELEASADGLPESAFYLAAKQLSDCRSMYLCKVEQKKLGYPQELWPKSPYIHPGRLANSTFEALYPVEHLSTLFRLCADLIEDCRFSFNDTDAELIRDVLRFQFDSTKMILEKAGYSFRDSSGDGKDIKIDHIISLAEHVVWG